jgi:NADH-quinone oxidoreductase subunit N
MLVIKIGIFFFFIRLLFYVFNIFLIYIKGILLLSSIGSLVVGSIGSIFQEKLKRLFIYTSISQVGFCFLGLLVGTPEGIKCAFLFFFVYIIASLGIFVIILNTSAFTTGKSLVYVSDLTNFGFYNPIYSIAVSIILLSMAGIPPLAGFFTKYIIFKLLVESSLYWLTIFSIIISVINSFIYIRLIKCLLFDKYIVSKDTSLKNVQHTGDMFLFDPGMFIWYFYEGNSVILRRSILNSS